MATKEFVLQGFTERTHLAAVKQLFALPDLQKSVLSAAFVTADGVNLLEGELKAHAKNVTLYAGIRNDITSHQALSRLLELGVTLYVVDTGSRSILFHPKLFLARSTTAARIVIGSANLTLGGLNNNIEAGLTVDCDLTVAGDRELIETMETQLAQFPKDYPGHVLAVSKADDIKSLSESGRVIDESAARPTRPSTTAKSANGDEVSRIALKVQPLRSSVKRTRPSSPRATTEKVADAIAEPAILPAAIGIEYDLVWESKELTERDLNIPTGVNTNRTGSISLDKGKMADEVDHRHYFREEVFSDLVWSPAKRPTVEEAFAKFQLVLKGVSYGEYELRIAHTKDTTSASYRQNNAMTRLSWGDMRDLVGRSDLLGRSLTMYRDKADATRFALEID